MQLHTLTRTHRNKNAKRIGRGGKRGKTSGRGMKGQKARAGGSPRPEMRDTIKRLPKRRGYGSNRARTVNPNRVRPVSINLDQLTVADPAQPVTPRSLLAQGIVSRKGGVTPSVKILSRGDVAAALTVEGCLLSASAKEKIEKAGGIVK